jgi:hypothetical protein
MAAHQLTLQSPPIMAVMALSMASNIAPTWVARATVSAV